MYEVPGTLLCAQDISVTETGKLLAFPRAFILAWGDG